MESQITFEIVAEEEGREEAGNLFDMKITTIYIDENKKSKKNSRRF